MLPKVGCDDEIQLLAEAQLGNNPISGEGIGGFVISSSHSYTLGYHIPSNAAIPLTIAPVPNCLFKSLNLLRIEA